MCGRRRGFIGVWLLLGEPSMHRMHGLNFARHRHVGRVCVHPKSHYGIVESKSLLLRLLALINVKTK